MAAIATNVIRALRASVLYTMLAVFWLLLIGWPLYNLFR